MKELIVNADDLGTSVLRNDGIFEAHDCGIVTSASLMASGDCIQDALQRLKNIPGLGTGLHLNLSDGRPCAEGHRTLVNDAGRFFGKQESRRRAREGRFDPVEVERETKAQIEALHSAGLRLTHLDSHQHLHVFGNLPEPIAKVTSHYGIRYWRCPVDTLLPRDGLSAQRHEEIEDYRLNALAAQMVFSRHGILSADIFGGIGLSGMISLEILIDTLRGLADGITELMVHPGKAETPDGFSGPAREQELSTLTHPDVKDAIKTLGIRLTTFGEIQPS